MNPRIIQVRVLFFRLAIVVVFLALGIQLWRLQIIEGTDYRLRADHNRFRVTSLEAGRGVIYDRRGTILVRNRPSFTVRLVPANVPEEEVEREAMFAQLASLLNVPVTVDTEAEDKLEKQQATLPLVFPPPPERPKKGIRQMYQEGLIVPFTPITLKTDVDRETVSLLDEMLVRLPGVEVSTEAVRQYVAGPLTAHLLGYVGHVPEEQVELYKLDGYDPNDKTGLTGVEFSYENELRGRKGQKTSEIDVAGREVRTVGPVVEAKSGHNLILTIDLELQRVMESALKKGIEAARSKSGVAIAINPKTGEILGMVSLPSFDDNLFSTGISTEDYLRLSIDKSRPLVNHTIGGQYPPGSVFKIIPAVTALQEDVIDTKRQFTCKGTMWVPNRYFPDDPELAQPFYCWNREGHGLVNFLGAIAQSCDIYFYQLGGGYGDFEGIGLDTLARYSSLFGLGVPTGVDLPAESKGLVPSAKWKRLTYGETWVTGDTYNMTIGQGFVLVTPLQMLNATTAIANGGTLYRPQVVRQIVDSDGKTIRPFRPQVIRELPISQENLALVREGMRDVVVWGTATTINLPQVSVAGKTGSAEFPGPRDNKGRLPTHAWFTAFAPYEDPQIVLVVFVEGGGEGSLVAVPVAAEILNYYFTAPADLVTAGTPMTPTMPSVITTTQQPGAASAPTPQPGVPPAASRPSFKARLVKVDEVGTDIGVLVGRVVDQQGRGIPGVQVTINGGGAPIFEPTTGPNGEFRYDMLNAYASPRWNVRVLGVPESEELHLDVKPFRQYTIEFSQP